MREIADRGLIEKAMEVVPDTARTFGIEFAYATPPHQEVLEIPFTQQQSFRMDWENWSRDRLKKEHPDLIIYDYDSLYMDVAVEAAERGLMGDVWYGSEVPLDISRMAVEIVENNHFSYLLDDVLKDGYLYALTNEQLSRIATYYYEIGSYDRLYGDVAERYESELKDSEEEEARAINPNRLSETEATEAEVEQGGFAKDAYTDYFGEDEEDYYENEEGAYYE